MDIERKLERPGFLTALAGHSKWSEITVEMEHEQTAQDRPDLDAKIVKRIIYRSLTCPHYSDPKCCLILSTTDENDWAVSATILIKVST